MTGNRLAKGKGKGGNSGGDPQEGQELPLAAACLRAGLNRERLMRRVLDGEIKGRQIQPSGRWVVDTASLDEYVQRNPAA